MNMQSLPPGDTADADSEMEYPGAPQLVVQDSQAAKSTGLPLLAWITQGLRASLLLKPSIGNSAPTPLQLFTLFALNSLLLIGLARLEIGGSAKFNVAGWLYPWCITSFMAFIVWAAFNWKRSSPESHPEPAAAWWGLWVVAILLPGLLGQSIAVLTARDWMPNWWTDSAAWAGWVMLAVLLTWPLAIAARLTAQLSVSRVVRSSVVVGLLVVEILGAWQQIGYSRPWYPDIAESADQESDSVPSFKLSQSVFEKQQALLAASIAGLQPGQANRVNVFGLVYAPYAQDVFKREANLVAEVLQQRFDASGRVLQMVNHVDTTDAIPWATNQNLETAIRAMASVMDRERDVLVIYMTSHGGSDFKLATAHWPLEVAPLTPQILRTMLDDARIRNRVIAVSACYSGGWIEPLSSDTAMVITAADATHTSYGCGNKSELTFFGRAMFDEQLRKTRSFEQAFKDAVPIIAKREVEGKKTDGFSNPQIAVGAEIRPVLARLEHELADRK